MKQTSEFINTNAAEKGIREAERRIKLFLGDDGEEKHLDLSNLNLTIIPDVIRHASGKLTSLDVSYNNIQDTEILSELKRLSILNVSNNQISNLKSIENLEKLKDLDAGYNKIGFVGISGLSYLEKLSLRNNNIRSIPEQRQEKLQFLDLSDNRIQNLDFLRGALALIELYLERNKLIELNPIQFLQDLEKLDLSHNQITDIGALKNLKKLTYLNLDYNQITSIEKLAHLDSLSELSVNHNKLSAIKGIDKLNNLVSVHLNKNQIKTLNNVPSSLKELNVNQNEISRISGGIDLGNLDSLDISDNKIGSFPNKLGEKIAQHENFSLNINNNPFFLKDKELNVEAYKTFDNESIFKIFKSDYHSRTGKTTSHGSRKRKTEMMDVVLPAKMVLLGNSNIGKSTLAKYLVTGGEYDPDIPSTKILDILNWKVDDKNQALIFDFGGQDFYHSAFRMFLSDDCIYVFMWTKNTNENSLQNPYGDRKKPYHNYNVNYWLSNIKYLTETDYFDFFKKTKVDPNNILVENKIDQPATNRSSLSYNDKIISLSDNFRVSLAGGESTIPGFYQRKQLLKSVLQDLVKKKTISVKVNNLRGKLINNYITHISSTSNKSDVDISELYLTKKQFLNKFASEGNYGPSLYGDVEAALVILHNRGLLLIHPETLNKQKVGYPVVENQDNVNSSIKNGAIWMFPSIVIEKIKALIDSGVNGIIQRQKNEFRPFIDLCISQSFILEKDSRELIVPSFLPEKEENILYSIASKGYTRLFLIKFKDFIPNGIMNRMILGFGTDARKKYYTKTTVIVELGSIGNVNVTCNMEDLTIGVGLQLFSEVDEDKVTRYIFQNIMAAYYKLKGLTWTTFKKFYDDSSRRVLDSTLPTHNRYPDWTALSNIDKKFWLNKIPIPEDLYISIEEVSSPSEEEFFVRLKDIVDNRFDDTINYINGERKMGLKTEYKSYKPFQFSPFLNKAINQPKKVFISYSHDDMVYKLELQKYLINLEREGLINIWQDGLIQAGEEWDQKIKSNLENADMVILLVSQNFIASNYIHEVEFRSAMQNRKNSDLKVLPILLSPCDWLNWRVIPEKLSNEAIDKEGKISNLQFMPMNTNGRLEPLIKWPHEAEAWAKIVDRIRKVINNQ